MCRQRIPDFIQCYFSYPGTWHTNKRALGWDLLKAPINLFWAPIYLSLQLIAFLLNKIRPNLLSQILKKTPSGIPTNIQRYLSEQTFSYLLGRSANDQNDQLHIHLSRSIENYAHLNHLTTKQIAAIDSIVHDALEQYRITRTASADIGNSLLSTIVGAFAFQKFTPGGIAIGLAIAGWLSNYWAVDSFFLGNWAGGLYYSIFPPAPSAGLNIASIAAVLACLAVIASFSGLITDPIQTLTGLHRKRLEKMLIKLEKDFLDNKVGGFRPKDQFVARILEVVDAAKVQLF